MRWAAIGVGVLSVGIVGYGLYLILVGQELTFLRAVPVGTRPGEATTRTVPALQGLIPIVGGVLVLAGLAKGRLSLAWLGALVLALFAGLFVFGVGGVLLPVVAALVVLLGVATWPGTSKPAMQSEDQRPS